MYLEICLQSLRNLWVFSKTQCLPKCKKKPTGALKISSGSLFLLKYQRLFFSRYLASNQSSCKTIAIFFQVTLNLVSLILINYVNPLGNNCFGFKVCVKALALKQRVKVPLSTFLTFDLDHFSVKTLCLCLDTRPNTLSSCSPNLQH